MIRQLTAQEQHVLETLVARVIDGHELPVVMTPEWVRPYVMNKVKSLVSRQVERLVEDPEGEDLQFNRDIPMPFGWTFGESGDFELDKAIATMYNQENERQVTALELTDLLGEGTADRLDFARNVRRMRTRKEKS
jgi:hypothetical protein